MKKGNEIFDEISMTIDESLDGKRRKHLIYEKGELQKS